MGRLKALGRALVELLSAEVDALGEELRGSARRLRGGVVLLVIGAFFGFWTVGALAYALVEILTFWLPRWGAALAATGGFALLTAIFAVWGRSRLKRLESPMRTVARRIEGHNAWVREQLLPEADEPTDPDWE